MATMQGRARLDADEIREHWRGVSATLSRLLELMDSREQWVVDSDPEFLELLAQLIEQVEDQQFAALMERGENAASLAEVMAMLCSSRFMRFLDMLEKRQAGMVSRLSIALHRLGGNAAVFASLFYERLSVVHRCELLGQIFSAQRAKRIAADLELIRAGE